MKTEERDREEEREERLTFVSNVFTIDDQTAANSRGRCIGPEEQVVLDRTHHRNQSSSPRSVASSRLSTTADPSIPTRA